MKKMLDMKKLTEIQAKALKYINEHHIDELIYVNQHTELFGITKEEEHQVNTIRWTHHNAKFTREPVKNARGEAMNWLDRRFDWCINGKTIIALREREIILPLKFHGEYPIVYGINKDIFNQYLKQINAV